MPSADAPVALVAGATGLVGRELVRQLVADGGWREVRALVRRPLPPAMSHSRVVAVTVDYAGLEPAPEWAAADHVFCALGTTMRQAGSAEAFRRVDLEYPLALARAALARGARHFLLVSAVGGNNAGLALLTGVATLATLVGGVIAAIAMIIRGERSPLVVAVLVLALLPLAFVTIEILFPHE